MKLRELIQELTFFGRQCTKDCSGHKAGWEWERKHNTGQRTATPSNSFNNGTEIAASQTKQGQRPIGPNIRGAGGRFQKFQKEPRQSQQPLSELFDHPVQWAWDHKENGHWGASFTINDIEYILALAEEPILNKQTGEHENSNVWAVEFQDPTADDPHGVTGKGNAPVVFATVIQMLMDFKQANPEATLYFTAKEASRQKLYNRIVGGLQRKGFQTKAAQSPTGGMGYLVR